MKKILYYLSNIVLGLYLIIYIPLFAFVKNSTPDGFQSHIVINERMRQISICVIVISIILKIFFRSNKFGLNKIDKIINIIIFVIEILLICFMMAFTSFA